MSGKLEILGDGSIHLELGLLTNLQWNPDDPEHVTIEHPILGLPEGDWIQEEIAVGLIAQFSDRVVMSAMERIEESE